MRDECEAWLSDGSDLVAEEMEFGLGWNSLSPTKLANDSVNFIKVTKQSSPQFVDNCYVTSL